MVLDAVGSTDGDGDTLTYTWTFMGMPAGSGASLLGSDTDLASFTAEMRTREFGIVMALGLKPGRLGRLVLLETAMMGLMGTALGALAGALLTSWFTTEGLAFPGMDEMAAQFNLPARMYPQVNLLTLLAGPVTVFVFTMLAAIYPAVRLRWQNPVDAMRVA